MSSQFSDRKYVIIAIFSSIIVIFIARLFYIQIVDDQYKLTARNQAFRYMTDYPARGNIFDRKGKRLVYNQAAYDLMVIPKQVKKLDTLDLCSILGIDKEIFIKRMQKAKQAPNSPLKPSVFEKEISVEHSSILNEKLFKFSGFFLIPRTLRKYPKPIAGHLLGYVGEVAPEMTDTSSYYKNGDYIGISGLEKAYEKATVIGWLEQRSFLNHRDENVTWKFIEIAEIHEVENPEDGVLLCSYTIEPDNAKDYIEMTRIKAEKSLAISIGNEQINSLAQ